MSILLIAAGFIAGSCAKPTPSSETPSDKPDPGKDQTVTPAVSISADATFNAELKANVKLTLSEKTDKDVKVKLTKAAVQDGKQELAADYGKNVTIKAGDTSVSFVAEADVMGLEGGEYQHAIKIESAEGATVAENAVVYINYTFIFKPEVSIYSDAQFASDGTAKVQLVLAKATSADVVVKLAAKADSKVSAKFDESVTIPAGETEKEITVTADIPSDIAPGLYPLILEFASIENGVPGKSAEATINLSYPFALDMTIDGVFDDWEDPSIVTYNLPDGALFTAIKTMKLAANAKYVYMFMEFEDPAFDIGRPMDLFINADGDPATGCYLHTIDNAGDYAFVKPWNNPGIEWYIEGALQDANGFTDFTNLSYYLKYTGADGDNFWSSFANTPSADPQDHFLQGTLENGIGRIELQLSRKFYGMTGSKAAIGFKLMDGPHDWNALGIFPQVASPSAPTYTAADGLSEVYLPAYAE